MHEPPLLRLMLREVRPVEQDRDDRVFVRVSLRAAQKGDVLADDIRATK